MSSFEKGERALCALGNARCASWETAAARPGERGLRPLGKALTVEN